MSGQSAGAQETVSIVIEWENALNADARRAVAMLEQVADQAAALASPSLRFETLVVFDPEVFLGTEQSQFILDTLGSRSDVLNLQLLELHGGGYYASKDLGARQASGEIVVFTDSDAVPESGWLEALLQAMRQPEVNLAIGSTYIDHHDLLGKAFALQWFFPTRSQNNVLMQTEKLYVNNMAVRRTFYIKHPFPEIPGTCRGSCVVLGARLASEGVPVYLATGARSSHPAPNGLRHLVSRALAQGRDRVIRERFLQNRWQQSWLAGCIRLPRHQLGVTYKTLAGHRRVGLSLWQAPAAIAIGCLYYFFYWLGEMGEHMSLKRLRAIRV